MKRIYCNPCTNIIEVKIGGMIASVSLPDDPHDDIIVGAHSMDMDPFDSDLDNDYQDEPTWDVNVWE